jgi:hypothetical protein
MQGHLCIEIVEITRGEAMPGRTFDMLLLSGLAGIVMFVCCALFGGAFLGGAFDRQLGTDGISDISARKMSPRH